MTGTVSLTIKIDSALKEIIKNLALENQTTLSEEVSKRLQASLLTGDEPVIDSQHTAESDAEAESAAQLSHSELKQIRQLLKKAKKKK